MQLKCERKQADLHKLSSEKTQQENQIKTRDAMIESL
jgi:hypothetical protein